MFKQVKNTHLLYKLKIIVLKTIVHHTFCLKAGHFLCYIELLTQFVIWKQKIPYL